MLEITYIHQPTCPYCISLQKEIEKWHCINWTARYTKIDVHNDEQLEALKTKVKEEYGLIISTVPTFIIKKEKHIALLTGSKCLTFLQILSEYHQYPKTKEEYEES